MNDYDIIVLKDDETRILIVMKTSESPFEYVGELQQRLSEIKFSGGVIIDELLHCGNTEERFISGYFDGCSFDNTQFKYEQIAKKSIIRNYICEYLKSDEEVLLYSGLTSNQQKMILNGCVI